MKTYLAFVIAVVMAFAAVSISGVEARRHGRGPHHHRGPVKTFYGPVTGQEQCTAEGKPQDLAILNSKDNSPSTLCQNTSDEICMCVQLRNKFGRRGRGGRQGGRRGRFGGRNRRQNEAQEEEEVVEYKYVCANCEYKFPLRETLFNLIKAEKEENEVDESANV